MPDRVGEKIDEILADLISQYIWEEKSPIEFNEYGEKVMKEAKSALLKVVCESLPKERKGDAEDFGLEPTWNDCRSQVIEAMKRLFGKEI